ncbi:MAG: M17 family peptidase N-terminal domain-containing protein [Myxococcota bacterium]
MRGGLTRVQAGLAALDALSGTEAICCFLSEDERPLSGAAGFLDWRLCGGLSRVLKAGFFNGAPGEKLLLPSSGQVPAPKIFAFGLGRSSAITPLGLEHALSQAGGMLTKAQVSSVALAFPTLPKSVDATRDEIVARTFAAAFSGRVTVFTG